ncbi:MAG: phosphoglycerate mutase family protein [Acidobacteriota bacterium]
MSFATSTCRRLFLLLLAVGTLAGLGQVSSGQTPFRPTTVFLVRHAEKQATPAADPSLTSDGELRAKNLARALSKAGVKAIFTSQFLRTKETARPLAEAASVAPVVISIQPDPSDRRKISEQSIRNLVDGIYLNAGGAVLVVGHSNTVPLVIAALGGGQVSEIPETEFDNLYVVTIYEKGKAKVAQLKY